MKDLSLVLRLAPDARVLVLDPEERLPEAALARELGATHVASGFVPPPFVSDLLARWITLGPDARSSATAGPRRRSRRLRPTRGAGWMIIWPTLPQHESTSARNCTLAQAGGLWRPRTTAGNRERVSNQSIRGGAVIMAAQLMKGNT